MSPAPDDSNINPATGQKWAAATFPGGSSGAQPPSTGNSMSPIQGGGGSYAEQMGGFNRASLPQNTQPSPAQPAQGSQQGRYRMGGGGPPSYTGGTPSGQQPAGAGMQQRMQPPWMQQQKQSPAAAQPQVAQPSNPAPAQQGSVWDQLGAKSSTPAYEAAPPAASPQPQQGGTMQGTNNTGSFAQQQSAARMAPPWQQQQQMGGGAPRPQYQGAPGPGQRAQMTGPQSPGQPQSMNMRQQMQSQRNPQQ